MSNHVSDCDSAEFSVTDSSTSSSSWFSSSSNSSSESSSNSYSSSESEASSYSSSSSWSVISASSKSSSISSNNWSSSDSSTSISTAWPLSIAEFLVIIILEISSSDNASRSVAPPTAFKYCIAALICVFSSSVCPLSAKNLRASQIPFKITGFEENVLL